MSWFSDLRATLTTLLRKPPPARQAAVSREALEALVGVRTNDLRLYERALMHRSKLRGQPNSHLASNERLEFLGDAVLGFVVAEYLYSAFPDENEGFLTRLRAKLVNGQALARVARDIDLGELILMSQNMAQSDGRDNTSILADAFEAIIGALYLDQGMDAARTFIHRTMLHAINLDDLAQRKDNYKSMLLEFVQARGGQQPQYRVLEERGPSHDKTFTVEVVLDGTSHGRGTAGSKKKAEQQAARVTLLKLRKQAASMPQES